MSSNNDKFHPSSSRPATRSSSSSMLPGDDAIRMGTSGARLSNSTNESVEFSFSEPISSFQAVKKRRDRPKKDKAGAEQLVTNLQGDDDAASAGWSCKECNVKFVSEDAKMLQCERCDGATCITCLRMDANAYELLKCRMDLHWYCGTCDRQAMSATKADWEIEERCAMYMKTLTRSDDMQSDLEKKAGKATVDNLHAEMITTKLLVEGANADIAKLHDKIELMQKEPEEIEKRKKNIVIRGLSEHEPEDVKPEIENVSDTKKFDFEVCEELFDSFGVDVTPKAVHRLGKKNPDGNPLPLKVIMSSEDDKMKAIRNGPKVRNVDASFLSFDPTKVFISPDMTILQRQEHLRLRDELRRRRQENPNWSIRGEKLVLKTPPSPPAPPSKDDSRGRSVKTKDTTAPHHCTSSTYRTRTTHIRKGKEFNPIEDCAYECFQH